MEKFKINQTAANLRYNRGIPPEKERKSARNDARGKEEEYVTVCMNNRQLNRGREQKIEEMQKVDLLQRNS